MQSVGSVSSRPGKPSEDLGTVPWLDFAEFDSEGRTFPLLIINLSSIKPIEEKAKKMTSKLVKKAFKSPSKVKGVNMTGDRTAQMAAMLEDMIKAGTMTNEMKAAVRKYGVDPDLMTDEDDENNLKKKRANVSANSSVASTDLFNNLGWN